MMLNFLRKLLLVLVAGLSASNMLADPAPENTSAASILARVRANIPQDTLLLQGQLRHGERIGRLQPACLMEARLAWGQTPPTACYTLSDIFGTPLERLSITRPTEQAALFQYAKRAAPQQPLQAAPTPNLDQPLAQTGLTWNDLSLAFLWETNGSVIGYDNVRGRNCIIIELPVPAAARPTTAYAWRRIWIDEHLMAVIQMDEYDAAGKLRRRLAVKNFKKIGDLWMIKNIDLTCYAPRSRTQIHIEEVINCSATGAPATAQTRPTAE